MSIRLIIGAAREKLAELPDESVHCVVTSPPYFGLRDYGTASWEGGDPACDHVQSRSLKRDNNGGMLPAGEGTRGTQSSTASSVTLYRDVCAKCGATRTDKQIGLEPTPAEFVAVMVEVFREVRRVLRKDGTLWLNLGSSYASGGNGASPSLPPQHVRPYGSDGTEPPDLTASGSACSDLCDECLADWSSHRVGNAGNGRPIEQSALPPLLTGHGSERLDCALPPPGALPLDVQASTSFEFWRQYRGECSRCAMRVSSLSGLRSSSPDARVSAGMSWLDYTTRLKPKDMIPIPWMVAMALQQDGWFLRQDIIWAKPNPMPESITDRCTKAHEYLFLLSKSARYHFDASAIAEAASTDLPVVDKSARSRHRFEATANGSAGKDAYGSIGYSAEGTRNRRSVWTVATQPFKEAHFATFPPDLIEPCIKAGCPKETCKTCGAAWRMLPAQSAHYLDGIEVRPALPIRSACGHDTPGGPPGTVLDPFGGAGTTGLVADRLQRDAILIELNPEYIALAGDRITDDAPLFATVVT